MPSVPMVQVRVDHRPFVGRVRRLAVQQQVAAFGIESKHYRQLAAYPRSKQTQGIRSKRSGR